MILRPDGMSARQVVKVYDPRLIALLRTLSDVLNENGIGLFCMRCHRLGIKDGVQGKSTTEEYVLECGCTRRTFKPNGAAKLHMDS